VLVKGKRGHSSFLLVFAMASRAGHMRAQRAAPLPRPGRLRDHPTNRGRPPVAPTELSRVHILTFDVAQLSGQVIDVCVGAYPCVRPNPGRRIGLPLRDAVKIVGQGVDGPRQGILLVLLSSFPWVFIPRRAGLLLGRFFGAGPGVRGDNSTGRDAGRYRNMGGGKPLEMTGSPALKPCLPYRQQL